MTNQEEVYNNIQSARAFLLNAYTQLLKCVYPLQQDNQLQTSKLLMVQADGLASTRLALELLVRIQDKPKEK